MEQQPRVDSGLPGPLRDFAVYLGTIRGKSPKTVEQYTSDLCIFLRYLKLRRGLADANTPFTRISLADVDLPLLGSVTLEDLYEYLYYITNVRKNQAAARARKVASLRALYRYLCERTGKLSENPTRNLESPRQKRALPKYLTLEESMELLCGTAETQDPREARDYCMLTLFLNCGIRLAELVGLNRSDIRGNTMTVTGKGNKQRVVYLNEACLDALAAYLAVRPREGVKGEDRDALFLSERKQRISPKTVQWVVYRRLEQAGLGGRGFSTHKLRHTAATLMYQHGDVDVRVLQGILGHTSLSTTEIYTHLSSKQMENAANRSPLAHFEPAGKAPAEHPDKKTPPGTSTPDSEKKDT